MYTPCKYEWVRKGRTQSTSVLLVLFQSIFTLLVETLKGVEEFFYLTLSSSILSQLTICEVSDEDQPGILLLPFRTPSSDSLFDE